MNASVIPFRRTVAVHPGSPRAVETSPSAPPPLALGGTLSPDLEALTAQFVEDFKTGSVFDAIADVVERAVDERRAMAHRPQGIIAAAAMDGLSALVTDLDVVIWRIAGRAALTEAEELERRLSGLPLDQALEVWRELTMPQRSAVLWVQARYMPGGAA